MTVNGSERGWFSAPRTELRSDRDGVTRAVFVAFRKGKLARVEQPDLEYPVFVHVGADNLPIGILFTAPISGEIEASIRYYLKAAPDGSALGVESSVVYSFMPIPPMLVEPAMRQVEQASRALRSA